MRPSTHPSLCFPFRMCRFWNTQPLLEHMVCSNEPGYYEDGAFGIRVENLFVVKEASTDFRCQCRLGACDC